MSDELMLQERLAQRDRQIEQLREELAARAQPPRPAALVRISPRRWEAFERAEDAEAWRREHYPPGPWYDGPPLWHTDKWVWHPATTEQS